MAAGNRAECSDVPGADGFTIALLVLHICIGCTVVAARAMPYTPPPVLKPAVDTHKDQSKVRIVWAEYVQKPWLCDQVRKAVAQYGRETVKQYAKARGYSKKQIDEAMACLTERKT